MLFNKITRNLKLTYNVPSVPSRSYERCVRLQQFYSSLKKAPTYDVVFMPTTESVMGRARMSSGWIDARLTRKGKIQARCAGHLLKRDGHRFDIGFCSLLSRGLGTLCHLFQEMGHWIDVRQHWRLNPQAMGAFTGQKLGPTLIKKYGIHKVDEALLTYRGCLPRMTIRHLYYENIREDKRYRNVLRVSEIPLRESLPRLQTRMLPYWHDAIGKQIKLNKKVIVVADDAVLRVLIKHLDHLSEEDTMKLKIRKATPFVYTLDNSLRSIRGKRMQYIDNLIPMQLNDYVMACPTTASHS